MITDIKQIDDYIINRIKKDYEQNSLSVSNISIKYNLERNIILNILINNNLLITDLPNRYINEKKFIVISDTHLGSKLDKIKYLEYVYNFAIKNKIKSIVHAGDLMQGTIRPVSKNLVDQEKQLNYIVKYYPYDETIKNHIVFGNHDFHTLSKKEEYIKILQSRKDFNLMGYKKAYLNWCNELIAVSHNINNYHIQIPNVDPFLRFVGHSHSMYINKNNVYVPPLCLDTKIKPNGIPNPGFLVVKSEKAKINIYHYIFQEHIYNTRNTIEILLAKERDIKAENLGIVLSRKFGDNKIK